ncbi:uncharacterized protein LOC133320234 isoform X2 [Danaus plexippus]|uniref:uncharacterized protein LOC133320234 isoform X2 n=1 Tax=Danaus plexippus TaxID=13037 RepID=UPI002AAF2C62|nr:uncharacterized protein LOC133320234 isoform X2 [Danaus plexippus]
MWNIRSRFSSACAVVLLSLLVSSAATDSYFDKTSLDNDSEYKVENENTIYPVAEYEDLGRAGEDPRKSLMENMMEYTERLTDAEDRRPSPKVEAKYPSWSELAGLKDVGIKKWVTALSNNVSSKLLPKNRRQLKWRKGTTVVCYLKLCSFKQPF